MDLIDRDGFRANVGIVLMNAHGQVFLGQRAAGKGWQFPQGGLRVDEPLEQGMFRELLEETGLEPEHVEVLGVTRRWLRYRLPRRFVQRAVTAVHRPKAALVLAACSRRRASVSP